MRSCILVFFFFLILSKSVNAQNVDTALFYYRYTDSVDVKVSSVDSADYLRLILPPDSGDTRLNVREYYKNSKLKFAGKSDAEAGRAFTTGDVSLTGSCASYFLNGKRQSVVNYEGGKKTGIEYLNYPNGTIYATVNHKFLRSGYFYQVFYLDCFTPEGTQICKDGNGEWIVYRNNFQFVLMQGEVKDGYFEGDWKGKAIVRTESGKRVDSIRYVYRFKKNILVSGTGYDQSGLAYPFKTDIEPPSYKSGPFTFIDVLRQRLKIPKDKDGNRLNLESIRFSFVIEKDGQLTDPQVTGCTDSVFINNLKSALLSCKGWKPRRYYGIPLRIRLNLPYKEVARWEDPFYVKRINYKFEILGF